MEKTKIAKRLSALENAQTATEMMTDSDCMELYGISKEQCLKNITDGIQKTQEKLQKTDEIITKIAMECIIAVEHRGDLETRMRDDDDFFEIAVWELKNALLKAYEAGRKNN
ncbi:MAG: hypothetical protein NC205_00315 [Prevotella sp.]|nr:hypothetical protein [Alistipes senegalensis]MCM1357005.1 hypothetical protein [Prevotella sp.]MCM1472624.1 hypothetical protein [Muribaculaceae bacterium]